MKARPYSHMIVSVFYNLFRVTGNSAQGIIRCPTSIILQNILVSSTF